MKEFSGWWAAMNKGKGRRHRNKKPAVVAVSGRRFTTVLKSDNNNNNNNNNIGLGHTLGRTTSSGTIQSTLHPTTNVYHSALGTSSPTITSLDSEIKNNDNIDKLEEEFKNNNTVRFDVDDKEAE